MAVRWLFAQLDTTIGQEKALRPLLSQLDAARRSRHEQRAALRDALGSELSADSPEPGRLDQAFADLAKSERELEVALRDALEQTRTILEPDQRKRLAELLGHVQSPWSGQAGPYRG